MSDDSTLTMEKLIKLKKDFDEMFPPRDHAKDTSIFSQFFMHYGFAVVPRDLPDNTIAVSTDVYLVLLGLKQPEEVLK